MGIDLTSRVDSPRQDDSIQQVEGDLICLGVNFDQWEIGDGREVTESFPVLPLSHGLFQGTISLYRMSREVPACHLDTPAQQLLPFLTPGAVAPVHARTRLHYCTAFLDSLLPLGCPNKAAPLHSCPGHLLEHPGSDNTM